MALIPMKPEGLARLNERKASYMTDMSVSGINVK
jgi:hypothetical protein